MAASAITTGEGAVTAAPSIGMVAKKQTTTHRQWVIVLCYRGHAFGTAPARANTFNVGTAANSFWVSIPSYTQR